MLPLAITCGDPSGVGPEIIECWLQRNPDRLNDVCLIGPKNWLETLQCPHTHAVGEHHFSAIPGQPSVEGAHVALEALEEAAYGCRQLRYRGVVTAPVSKHWMEQAGWSFPGQTEFFAERWFGQPSMAFAGGKLRVVLTTWHVPLIDVPNHLTEESITRAVKNAHFLAERLGAASPARIGVCGLNPHAGEGGLLGFEEQGIIDPILDNLRDRYPNLSSCQPGDTLFWRQMQGEFDVIIAMYHDQGLAPLKAVDFDQAVNLTLGLSFIRTSPDHGTAFGIAGQGKAGITSFANAVELADKMSFI
ncbi:PdxA family dehydrogenase [Cerasicoccus arenae]|uniref:4-hydroxythreonine-4-phosphate dehydrogenase n=1 Tax=Cerasicoccus arenae TaxID=424488 RepID=A0A8J3DEI2_9BACT|nr:4-hydroxythreonine-4-phosphate dehydrogenase PdxA [Cerasicoccus arenae]MBK1856878.1 4-hydroxythreonine-4-phosphate dehydrogenase PdxA [Cerasicoccus arenae]GHB89620.1 4-hydroxythreonine-4-phosphate dehydrogenase [Cerasicoccus arenae]